MQYNLTLWGESGRAPEILRAHGCGGEKSFHQPRPPRQDWPSPLVRFKVLCGNVLQPLLPISQEKQTPLQPPARTVWAAARAQPRLCRQGWKAAHPLQTPAKEKPPQAEKPSPKPKPRTSQAKFHICFVQVFSTAGQEAEGKPLSWTMYSPTGHINVQTLVKHWWNEPCLLAATLPFQSARKITASFKIFSSGASLKTHSMRNFPPSDCILIVAQIVS